MSQALISRIELGRLEQVSLQRLRLVGATLDIVFSIDAWWRSGELDRLIDRGHAALVEHVVGDLRDHGWVTRVEVTFNHFGERGSADIVAWHPPTRTLLIIEVKTRIGDVQETASTFERKVRLLPDVLAREEGWEAAVVGRILVVADTHANRSIVRDHHQIFGSIWPELTAATRRWIRHPADSADAERRGFGGIWFLPYQRLASDASRLRQVQRPPTAISLGGVIDLLRRTANQALDAALPAQCVGCGHEGPPLCAVCAPALDRRLEAPAGVPIGLPGDLPAPLLQLDWCAPFSGTVRAALHAIKYGGEQRLAEPLGIAIARRWSRVGVGTDLVTHVPVHADRARTRGYDQAALIAKAAARHLGLPYAPLLARERATIAQFDLDRSDRATNVAGAFAVGPGGAAPNPAGRWVLLVDDVVTTGATLAACAEALEQAGALGTSAITVARER